jgi:membrane-bound metal-dependent hydrolase YbcI (DUF457 family)
VIFAISHSPPLAFLAAFCAKLPDQMEHFLPGVKHRGITHVFVLWAIPVAILVAALLVPALNQFFTWDPNRIYRFVLLGLFAGGLLHVLADFLSISGIPFLPGRDGFGLKWYKTGTFSEFGILSMICLACIASIVLRDHKTIDYLRHLISQS